MAEFAHDVTGLQVRSNADRQVNAFFNQVGALVRKIQQQLNMGMGLRKRQQMGHQALQAKAQGQRQANAPAGHSRFFHQAGFRCVYQVQDDAALLQVGRARRRERQAARAAGHEFDRQLGLQRGNLAGHDRAGHLHLLGDGRKAAGLRDPHKGLHCIKLVHCCVLCNKLLLICVLL